MRLLSTSLRWERFPADGVRHELERQLTKFKEKRTDLERQPAEE